MGNIIATRRNGIDDDAVNATVFSLAQAAALGARNAVMEAHRLAAVAAAQQQQGVENPGAGAGAGEGAGAAAAAQQQQGVENPGAGGGAGAGAGGGAPPAAVMVGGVLPLSDAANAAAKGADDAVGLFVRFLPEAQRRLLTVSESKQVQTASVAGAAAGVWGAVSSMAANAPAATFPPEVLPADLEAPPPANPQAQGGALELVEVAEAAAAGAWIAAFKSIRAIRTSFPVNSWATRLAPLLAASVGMAGTLCPHFSSAAEWEIVSLLGGVGLLLFTLMIGVAAVPVPLTTSMKPEAVSRHAAFIAFIIIGVLFVSVLCYLLRRNNRYLVPVGIVGVIAIAVLFCLWGASGSCERGKIC